MTVSIDDDPYQIFEAQCEQPEEQRIRALLLDARNATADEVRSWLDRCDSIPGFLEGSAAEWLIEQVTVIGGEPAPSEMEGVQWIQTEMHDRQRLMTAPSTTLSPEDDMEQFLQEQQDLPVAEQSAVVLLDARGRSMETIERWIAFFFQYCDAHAERVGQGAYEPTKIMVMSEHEQPEIFSGTQQLRWIQTSSGGEDLP